VVRVINDPEGYWKISGEEIILPEVFPRREPWPGVRAA
jgi:hypothetical protein